MLDGRLGSVSGLVDVERGIISREIFVSDEIYRQEQERIFSRAWLLIGHDSQVPKPGDFFASSMGEESVILCRDPAGQIHVFLNSCRHRGMKVCRYDQGNTVEFLCPYHGWSYATDGALVGVPHARDAYGPQLDRSRWGLVEVPRIANYKGTIWATWAPDAPSFADYLGGYKIYLDLLLDAWDGREGGAEVIGGVHKWLVPCNWKFPAENFSGDRYHGVSHRSVDMVGIGPSGQGRRDNRERNEAQWLDVSFPDLGHSMIAFLRPPDAPIAPAYQDAPVVADYFRQCEEERKRRRGTGWRLFGGPGTVFPNASPLARQPRTIAAWHPRGPHQTEVWRWYLVDADAPAEVKDFLRHYYIRYSGPAGLTEQDDMENWNYAHNASRGTIARQHPYNYEMGLGRATESFEDHGLKLPGRISVVTGIASENNQRGFYTRWRQLMEAGQELAGAGAAVTGSASDITRLLLKEEIQDLLYWEAELLDERRFEEWLDLLTEDVHYWVPMRRNVPSQDTDLEFTRAGLDVNWFDEGKDTLTRRVRQIRTGVHWAEEPASRICHMVSNVQIVGALGEGPPPSEIAVKSRFLVYRNRVETETDLLVGKREDLLRRVDGRWRIARRKVILDQSVLLAKNLTFFL